MFHITQINNMGVTSLTDISNFMFLNPSYPYICQNLDFEFLREYKVSYASNDKEKRRNTTNKLSLITFSNCLLVFEPIFILNKTLCFSWKLYFTSSTCGKHVKLKLCVKSPYMYSQLMTMYFFFNLR